MKNKFPPCVIFPRTQEVVSMEACALLIHSWQSLADMDHWPLVVSLHHPLHTLSVQVRVIHWMAGLYLIYSLRGRPPILTPFPVLMNILISVTGADPSIHPHASGKILTSVRDGHFRRPIKALGTLLGWLVLRLFNLVHVGLVPGVCNRLGHTWTQWEIGWWWNRKSNFVSLTLVAIVRPEGGRPGQGSRRHHDGLREDLLGNDRGFRCRRGKGRRRLGD